MDYIPTFSEVDKSYMKEEGKATTLGKIKKLGCAYIWSELLVNDIMKI